MSAAAWILGAHLLTAHTNNVPETITPGMYISGPNGVTLGVVRNSYGRLGHYAAYTWQTEDRYVSFGLTVGGITGYKIQTVRPMLVPSMRLRLTHDSAMRLSFIPKSPQKGRGDALGLSFESGF